MSLTNTPAPAQQALLTDDEILRTAINASDSLNITRVHEIGGPSRTIMEDAGLLELGRAIESALLSKLRAPVADERALPPLPAAWGSAINDAGDGHVDLYSAEQLQDYARAALASAPVAGEAVVDQRENNRHYYRGYSAAMRRLQRELVHTKDEYERAVLKVVDRLIEAQKRTADAAREYLNTCTCPADQMPFGRCCKTNPTRETK